MTEGFSKSKDCYRAMQWDRENLWDGQPRSSL